MWRPYQFFNISEESDSNGRCLNWSEDNVLAMPTLFQRKTSIGVDQVDEKSARKSEIKLWG